MNLDLHKVEPLVGGVSLAILPTVPVSSSASSADGYSYFLNTRPNVLPA